MTHTDDKANGHDQPPLKPKPQLLPHMSGVTEPPRGKMMQPVGEGIIEVLAYIKELGAEDDPDGGKTYRKECSNEYGEKTGGFILINFRNGEIRRSAQNLFLYISDKALAYRTPKFLIRMNDYIAKTQKEEVVKLTPAQSRDGRKRMREDLEILYGTSLTIAKKNGRMTKFRLLEEYGDADDDDDDLITPPGWIKVILGERALKYIKGRNSKAPYDPIALRFDHRDKLLWSIYHFLNRRYQKPSNREQGVHDHVSLGAILNNCYSKPSHNEITNRHYKDRIYQPVLDKIHYLYEKDVLSGYGFKENRFSKDFLSEDELEPYLQPGRFEELVLWYTMPIENTAKLIRPKKPAGKKKPKAADPA